MFHFVVFLVSVPPANPLQQQTPQASPQSQPQPSPPPNLSQKKSGLPPLAPKPSGAKLPQSGGSSSATIKQLPKLLPKPQSPPEVCLRWNSYHSNMQNTFPSLLNNEQFVDVTLACDGRSIKCHKVSYDCHQRQSTVVPSVEVPTPCLSGQHGPLIVRYTE